MFIFPENIGILATGFWSVGTKNDEVRKKQRKFAKTNNNKSKLKFA